MKDTHIIMLWGCLYFIFTILSTSCSNKGIKQNINQSTAIEGSLSLNSLGYSNIEYVSISEEEYLFTKIRSISVTNDYVGIIDGVSGDIVIKNRRTGMVRIKEYPTENMINIISISEMTGNIALYSYRDGLLEIFDSDIETQIFKEKLLAKPLDIIFSNEHNFVGCFPPPTSVYNKKFIIRKWNFEGLITRQISYNRSVSTEQIVPFFVMNNLDTTSFYYWDSFRNQLFEIERNTIKIYNFNGLENILDYSKLSSMENLDNEIPISDIYLNVLDDRRIIFYQISEKYRISCNVYVKETKELTKLTQAIENVALPGIIDDIDSLHSFVPYGSTAHGNLFSLDLNYDGGSSEDSLKKSKEYTKTAKLGGLLIRIIK